MVFAQKLLIVIFCSGIGILVMMYTEPLVRMIGKMYWAEKYLGMGGTYTAWKIIGVLLIIGSLAFVTVVNW